MGIRKQSTYLLKYSAKICKAVACVSKECIFFICSITFPLYLSDNIIEIYVEYCCVI